MRWALLKGFSSSSDITSPQVSCSLGLCPSCSFCQSCSFCLPYFLCLCVYRPVSTPTPGHPCTTYTGDLFELVRGDLAGLQGVQPGMLRYLVEDLLGQEFDHQDLADCAEEVLVVCLSCVCRVSVVGLSWVSCVPAIRLPCICRALLSSRLCSLHVNVSSAIRQSICSKVEMSDHDDFNDDLVVRVYVRTCGLCVDIHMHACSCMCVQKATAS